MEAGAHESTVGTPVLVAGLKPIDFEASLPKAL